LTKEFKLINSGICFYSGREIAPALKPTTVEPELFVVALTGTQRFVVILR